jgi:hypothetical protein
VAAAEREQVEVLVPEVSWQKKGFPASALALVSATVVLREKVWPTEEVAREIPAPLAKGPRTK